MFRRLLMVTMMTVSAFAVSGVATFAQQTDAKQDAKKAGKEVKEAGKQTGEAAKDAGKATAKVTKKTAKTITRKLTPNTTHAVCKDGTTQSGKTKTTACADHGGVK